MAPEKKASKQASAKKPDGRKLREGFYMRDRQHSYPRPTFRNARRIKIGLAANTQVDDEVFTLAYHSANGEIIRMLPDPIVVKYLVHEKNEKYEESATARATLTGDNKWKAEKRLPCMMGDPNQKTASRASINPAFGAHAWFQECWITVDGEDICSHFKRQGLLNGFYCYFMMIFCTALERMRLWGVDYLVCNSGQEGSDSPEGKKALETLNFESWTNPKYRTARMSYEGVPWVGMPKNPQVSKLQGVDPSWNYIVLPPNTTLEIHFKRHNPSWAFFDQTRIVDSAGTAVAYEANKLHSEANMANPPRKYDVTIEDVFIDAEVISLDTSVPGHRNFLNRLSSSTQVQYIDIPNTSLQTVPDGTTRASLQFDVAANTPIVYIAFVYRDNVFYNAGSNHSCTYRCTLPKNCTKISFSLGSEEILFQDGLKDLHVDGSVDRERFYQYLKDNNMYDYDNPDYFARDKEGISYRVVFPINLSQFSRTGPQALGVHLEFDSNLSPKNLLGVCSRAETYMISRGEEAGRARWDAASAANKE